MGPRDSLSATEIAQLDQVRLTCPEITHTCNLARAFADLVRQGRGNMLHPCIRRFETSDLPPLQSLASSLRQDFDAVTAGLTLAWSCGVIEGHVNRVKTIKRAVYGRGRLRPAPHPHTHQLVNAPWHYRW